MSIYKGSSLIRESGSYGVYHGSTAIKSIYKGSTLIYNFATQQTKTFSSNSSLQTFTIPSGVTSIHVDCVASRGYNTGKAPGKGGRVECNLQVTPGSTLYLMIGGIPTSSAAAYNAADIRTNNAGVTDTTSLNSRLVVAGGGGSSSNQCAGGAGGGLTGGNGSGKDEAHGGSGGTQTAGGKGGTLGGAFGTKGYDGTFGLGGTYRSKSGNSGAGGAGWYGGGGGSVYQYLDAKRAGGGGGSSYTNPTLCSNVVHTQGYQDGEGYITITYYA